MRNIIISISSLLFGNTLVLLGMGLMGILLGIRAGMEGFSATATGIIMSSYFLGYALGTFVCPGIIQRVGHIRAFAVLASIASTTAILHAIFVNPYAWTFIRVLNGMSIVGLTIVLESWFNVLVPNEKRGKLFATYLMVTFLSLAFGQFLVLMADVNSFISFGVVSVLLSLSLVPIALTRVKEPVPVKVPTLNLKTLYKTSPFGVVGTICSGLVVSAFWGMGPLFGHRLGLDPSQVATYMFVTILGGALLQWPVGHLSDNHDRRKVLLFVSLSAAILALVISFTANMSYGLLLLLSFLYGGVSFSLYGISVAHTNDHVAPENMLEASKGLLLVYGIGATLGPFIAGLVMTEARPSNLYLVTMTTLTIIVLFGLYRLAKPESVSVEEQTEFSPMIRTSQVALELNPRLDAGDTEAGEIDGSSQDVSG